MSKPTPGPWVSRLAADGCGDIGIVADGGCVAECFHEIRERGEGAYAEQAANARLIAAAPELLEALQRLLPAYRAAVKLLDPNTDDSLTVAARAAIAKAGGAA